MKRLLYIIFLYCFAIVTLSTANGQIELSEVMTYPIGDAPVNQYIEFVVPPGQSVAVNRFYLYIGNTIHELHCIDSSNVVTDGYGIVVTSGYQFPTGRYTTLRADSVHKFVISGAEFYPGGLPHNQPIRIDLMDSTYHILSSIETIPITTMGHSIERKWYVPHSYESNLMESITEEGTPGFRNSISVPKYDIAIDQMAFGPLPGTLGTAQVRVTFRGAGEYQTNYSGAIFVRRTSIQQYVMVDSIPSRSLGWNEAVQQEYQLPHSFQQIFGPVEIKVMLRNSDHVARNDTLSILTNYWHNQFPVITEWMPKPLPGEPRWIELLWEGAPAYFSNWEFRSGTSTTAMRVPFHSTPITTNARFLIAEAPLPTRFRTNPTITFILPNWSIWNNASASMSELTPWGQLVEQLPAISQLPFTVDPGRSVVRRDYNRIATIPENWYASNDSLFAAPQRPDAPPTSDSIINNPLIDHQSIGLQNDRFAPDGVAGVPTELKVIGNSNGGLLTIKIYDLSGKTRFNRTITVPSGSFLWSWNGQDDHGDRVAAGVYIIDLSSDGKTWLHKAIVVVR